MFGLHRPVYQPNGLEPKISLIVLIATGLLTNYFTKNMIITLGMAILVSVVVRQQMRSVEGFKEEGGEEKEEEKDGEMAPDIALYIHTLQSTTAAPRRCAIVLRQTRARLPSRCEAGAWSEGTALATEPCGSRYGRAG